MEKYIKVRDALKEVKKLGLTDYYFTEEFENELLELSVYERRVKTALLDKIEKSCNHVEVIILCNLKY